MVTRAACGVRSGLHAHTSRPKSPTGPDLLFTATTHSVAALPQLLTAQAEILETQIRLEDAFTSIAGACGRNAVVLCDRGTMDGKVRPYCICKVLIELS